MQEKNQHILKESIKKMTHFEPKENIWNEIEAKLNEQSLQNAISKMRSYEPNEVAWQKIEKQLSAQKTTFQLNKIVRFSMAASVTFLLGFFLFYVTKQPKTTLTYSTEKLDARLCLSAIDDSEKQCEMINSYCKSNIIVCQNPSFHALKNELDELSLSSNRLKEAIGAYNTDSQLIVQLTAIEQQKAEILRKMARFI